MSWWAWFQAWANTNSGAVSILGVWITAAALLSGWIWTRSTNKLITAGEARTQVLLRDVHAETQVTLKSMDATTKETLRSLGEGQSRLGEILSQMETNATDRYRDLKDRLDGEQEVPPA